MVKKLVPQLAFANLQDFDADELMMVYEAQKPYRRGVLQSYIESHTDNHCYNNFDGYSSKYHDSSYSDYNYTEHYYQNYASDEGSSHGGKHYIEYDNYSEGCSTPDNERYSDTYSNYSDSGC